MDELINKVIEFTDAGMLLAAMGLLIAVLHYHYKFVVKPMIDHHEEPVHFFPILHFSQENRSIPFGEVFHGSGTNLSRTEIIASRRKPIWFP